MARRLLAAGICVSVALLCGGCSENKEVSEQKKRLKSKSPAVRKEAAKEIARLGAEATDAIPELQTALRDESPDVRIEAAIALAAMGAEAKDAVPDLIAVLKEEGNQKVFRSAAIALSKMEQAAAPAVPQLATALENSDPQIRGYAILTLGKIGAEAKLTADRLAKIVVAQDNADWVRARAARAIGEIGTGASSAIPQLTQALRDENHSVRAEAVWALGEMGPLARDAAPAIRDLIRVEPVGPTRDLAREVLKKIGA